MCKNKIKIQPKYWHHEIYVNCGHCAACLQEKANKRAQRIRNEEDFEKYDFLFINLTYENRYLPYILYSDLRNFVDNRDNIPLLGNTGFSLPVYRDRDVRFIYNRHNKTFIRKDYLKTTVIRDFGYCDFESSSELDYRTLLKPKYKYVRTSGNRFNSYDDGKISVIFKKDIQDFIKRYRQWLKRKGYDFKTKFFCCSEYGPSTHRCHNHLLAVVPKGYFQVSKSAIIANWHYSNLRRPFWLRGQKRECVEPAKSPSKYLAEYVNCDTSIQGILRDARPFRPQYSYSHHFGFSKKDFSIYTILEKVRRGSLFYDCTINRDGVPTPSTIPYPKYVISYYFPKFKGYNNLTSDEITDIVYQPQRIYEFREQCNLTFSDCYRISVSLFNKRDELFSKYGIDRFDYSVLFPAVWNCYKSSLLRWFHEQMIDPLESYDNISEFYHSDLFDLIRSNEFVRSYYVDTYDPKRHYEDDPNLFQDNLRKDDYLKHRYFEASKDFKVKDLSYVYG